MFIPHGLLIFSKSPNFVGELFVQTVHPGMQSVKTSVVTDSFVVVGSEKVTDAELVVDPKVVVDPDVVSI